MGRDAEGMANSLTEGQREGGGGVAPNGIRKQLLRHRDNVIPIEARQSQHRRQDNSLHYLSAFFSVLLPIDFPQPTNCLNENKHYVCIGYMNPANMIANVS